MLTWIPWQVWLIDAAVRIVLLIRVVSRRLPVSVALAWITVLLFLPVVGPFVYLLVGESRLGRLRLRRHEELSAGMDRMAVGLWLHRNLPWAKGENVFDQVARFGTAVTGLPPLRGNHLDLFGRNAEMIAALIADIDRAESSCHLVYYIWMPDTAGHAVAEAVMRASRRGVACRVLVDGVGGWAFFKSELPQMMRSAGVQVVESLPVSFLRFLFARIDLRNHRKIAVIDGKIAYTGSQNITDETFRAKPHRETGPWIDASVRVTGPAAQALGLTFLMDWQLDGDEDVRELRRYLPEFPEPAADDSVVQVVPSGPGPSPEVIHQALLGTMYTAREELILTTPYFVPDPAVVSALRSAAMRGVRVTLVVPAVLDAPVVGAAARSYYQELMDSGVRIYEYQGGLLHSKMLTADRVFGIIGSANIDIRSFWLNFEITLLVYDSEFASVMRFLQTDYMNRSVELDLESWRRRPLARKAMENAARMLGPLL
ncbi:MAG: cardiolipin synthase [Phycisphaeraceae bacterium]|nr:cardiolipin synthase [Phycisphaeraceae bacterium]